ncbi:MAG TPA: acyl-CoA reductase, partial [Polyangiales bacterium]|nr:acyl-CoA reductase [Polyangiales bacterium]
MSAPETSRAEEVRAAIATLRGAAAKSGSDSARVIAALQKTALILSDAREPTALELRRGLQEETGLSLPMIEWGLLTSLSSMRHAPLAELASTVPADAAHEVIGVVLAGNVFVAAVRGLALPLLAGAHVIAKTASSEGAFARAFQAALTQADAAIGARLAVVHFSRADEAATRALCTGVDALSVYGSDETVEQLRNLCATSPSPGALARDKRSASSAMHDRTSANRAGIARDDAPQATCAVVKESGAVGLPPESSAAANDRANAKHVSSDRDDSAAEASASSNAASARSVRDDASATAAASSDEASADLESSRLPRIIAHGHGLSAAYVARSALSSSEEAARAAERVALDIAAYDQHGCLSPHFVLVEPG